MPWLRRKCRIIADPAPGSPNGASRRRRLRRREAPVERQQLLGHGRETELFGALARATPHLQRGANIQASELVRKRIDLESADHVAIHPLLDQFGCAAL